MLGRCGCVLRSAGTAVPLRGFLLAGLTVYGGGAAIAIAVIVWIVRHI